MAGWVIGVFRRRTFDFSGLASLTTIVLPLFRIDLGDATSATLLTRVHGRQLSTGDRVTVQARITQCSPEDVNEDFDESRELAASSVVAATPVPSLLRSAVQIVRADQLVIEVAGRRGNMGTTTSATVSADLILKD